VQTLNQLRYNTIGDRWPELWNSHQYNILVSVGQLAEIAGIGDQGESGEQIIRQVASLATVRGDAFSIYSCGQAINVVNGRVAINREKILHAMVE